MLKCENNLNFIWLLFIFKLGPPSFVNLIMQECHVLTSDTRLTVSFRCTPLTSSISYSSQRFESCAAASREPLLFCKFYFVYSLEMK